MIGPRVNFYKEDTNDSEVIRAGYHPDTSAVLGGTGMHAHAVLRYGKGGRNDESVHVFTAIGPEPWNVAYVEPSRRPADGRYGENPNRLYQHHQFQVLMKPSPQNIQELYLQSYSGWELWQPNTISGLSRITGRTRQWLCRGRLGSLAGRMEVTQFTYFQQVGGLEVNPVAVEVTYGLERLSSYIQGRQLRL